MPDASFTINDRFSVQPATNTVTDQAGNTQTRVEPRLMQVLCALADNPGQPVLRETLVSQIWNDYGGGDEGLTQAISALRKLLRDDRKEIIQTIPKKGYCFGGSLSHDPGRFPAPDAVDKRRRDRVAVAAAILTILAVAFGVLYQSLKPEPAYAKGVVVQNKEAEARLEETSGNTIVAVGSDSTRYKLVMIGDRPPRFYINDSLLATDKWERHMDLINSLKRQLQHQ